MAHNARKHAKKQHSKGVNNGPSRQSYWASGRLRERKIKAIMKNNRLSRAEATILWLNARQGRIKK